VARAVGKYTTVLKSNHILEQLSCIYRKKCLLRTNVYFLLLRMATDYNKVDETDNGN